MSELKTGYPHIDKPWMQYYDEAEVQKELPKKTIFENMRDNIQENLNNVAITYNKEEVIYDEFLSNVKLSAKILTALDVSTGERILYLMANLPETAYTFFGTNYIGAISDYIDPRPDSLDFNISAKKVLEIIKKEKINHIVALDQCYLAMVKPVENEIKEMGITKVLLVSASDSMSRRGLTNYIEEYIKFNGLKATLKKIKYLKTIEEKLKQAISTSVLDVIFYKDMMQNVNSVQAIQNKYTSATLAAITHSSGTSGTFPKTIPLTNEGIISYGFQLSRSNTGAHPTDSTLQILPYFSAYGLGIANFGYSNAYNMIQVPEFSPNNLGNLINKYKPNVIMGTPNWYLSMPTQKVLKASNLSHIKIIGYGGDSMNAEDEAKINKFLHEHNCNVKITKGHGMSEISGGSSYAVGDYNLLGSMGIPMIDTIYAIVDPETKKLIKFEHDEDIIQGEFIVSSPAIVDEIFDDNLVVKHCMHDGIDFIYTGDIGTMDRNGILYFLTRKDRGFTRYDGFKVKPYEIENNIKEMQIIKDCIITSFFNENVQGNLIQANVLLNESAYKTNYDDIVDSILNNCFIKNSNTSTRQIPSKIVFKKMYPITKNGKIDYMKLSEIDEEDIEFNILLDETSISVNNIRVEQIDNQKTYKKR